MAEKIETTDLSQEAPSGIQSTIPEASVPIVEKKLEKPVDAVSQVVANGVKAAQTALPSPAETTSVDPAAFNFNPSGAWPPPIFLHPGATPQERYYMEHRWHTQWVYYDKKANENKVRYHRLQWIIGVGAVTVPVLVGIPPTALSAEMQFLVYAVTVVISLAVAVSTAIENIYKYGDNWRTFRNAAEEMQAEKSLYDVRAGRYAGIPYPFTRFVERCEEVIAQQNGRWVQTVEKQQTDAEKRAQEFIEEYAEPEKNKDSKAPSAG